MSDSISKEARASKNSSRSKLFCVVYHPSKDDLNVVLDESKLESVFKNWVYIYHNSDVIDSSIISLDLLPMKPNHFHLVVETASRTYPSAINKLLCSLFGWQSNQLSVDVCKFLPLSVRYLCHLDNKNKHQYDLSLLHFNNYSWVYQNLQCSSNQLKDFIISTLKDCGGDYFQVLNTLGLDLSKQYYQVISQWFRCYYKR